MARKTTILTIEDNNRDKGKKFKITEMSAIALDKWASKAILALANSGADIPADSLNGIQGLGTLSANGIMKLITQLKYEQAQPLYDELLNCCEFLDGSSGRSLSVQNADEIVEELTTLLKLRWEVLKLSFDFLAHGVNSD